MSTVWISMKQFRSFSYKDELRECVRRMQIGVRFYPRRSYMYVNLEAKRFGELDERKDTEGEKEAKERSVRWKKDSVASERMKCTEKNALLSLRLPLSAWIPPTAILDSFSRCSEGEGRASAERPTDIHTDRFLFYVSNIIKCGDSRWRRLRRRRGTERSRSLRRECSLLATMCLYKNVREIHSQFLELQIVIDFINYVITGNLFSHLYYI